MLHLTNGDRAAGTIRATGIEGVVIPWRDVLHLGPVPGGLALEPSSEVRARFIAAWSGLAPASVRAEFAERDAALRRATEVVLWFEHDLYDQLQLIQILGALGEQPATEAWLINIAAFPGVAPFHGLGQLDASQLASLWPRRVRVTAAQHDLAARAWAAFTSADPGALRRFVEGEDGAALPFLRPALARLLEEFPAAPDGLSRTERQVLRAVADGHASFPAIFRATQQREEAPFMGDTVLQLFIDELTHAKTPLLTREPIALTEAGRRVVAGEIDRCALNPIDRWIGGVRVTG